MSGISTEAAIGPWTLRWRRFRRNRAGMASLLVLLGLMLFVLAAIPMQMLGGMNVDATDLFARFGPPGPGHPLRRDEAGRGVLLRLMVG
ncbi:MAG: hypothetical protein H7251_14665, partial [Acetobacteraceae bacterium]|nr:hypothetical protein [Acetobacteraceae bacterium]